MKPRAVPALIVAFSLLVLAACSSGTTPTASEARTRETATAAGAAAAPATTGGTLVFIHAQH